jgi:3-oxoacyl-[acyl-carrier protein] reductase
MAKAAMARENISYGEARARQIESIAARRLGDPREFGSTCAFLCSIFAGFMSGQNPSRRRIVSGADLNFGS